MMGVKTDWGDEIHHTDYENHVDSQTGNYQSSLNVHLHFDGVLANVSAYNAALSLARDTPLLVTAATDAAGWTPTTTGATQPLPLATVNHLTLQ